MRGERKIFCMIMVGVLLTGTFLFFPAGVLAPSSPKTVYGLIDLNSTTGTIAYPGNSTFYIMNWRENGTDTGPMVSSGGVEYFNMDIEDNITWWEPGDIGVVIVDVETGSYPAGDRAGFVAYTTKILTDSDDIFPQVELQKIPVPTKTMNGTGFINISWDPLPDPMGMIAGYKIYRSTSNNSDASWELVGGSKDAPLTDLWFNNTNNVTAGVPYYYSVKLSFKGYQSNNPSNVNNHQNMYFGEGSGSMTSPGAPPTVDYIRIDSLPGGTGSEIQDQTVDVGVTISGYAVAYNDTLGLQWDVSVTWSIIQFVANATTTPSSGTASDFWSGWNGEAGVIWQATDGTHTDNITFTINPPGVDRIEIVDTPGTGLTKIGDATVDVGYTITGYAAGFNNTIGYFTDVSVTWSVLNGGASNATTTPPGPDTSSMFNASNGGGSAQWRAEDGSGHIDTVDFTINSPVIDFLLIVDAPGGAGVEITNKSVGVNTTVDGWVCAYNHSVGYLYEVFATWIVDNVGGANAVTNPGTGENSTFDAKPTAGTATWRAQFGGLEDTVEFDILIPTVDYIEIVYSQGTGTNPIPLTINVGVGVTITGYAAAFNGTVGYLYDWSVNWTVTPSGTENATTTPLMNSDTSAFWSGWIGGTVYWNATDGYGHTYSVEVTIDPPVVNYIKIVDTLGTGLTEIQDQDIFVGMPMTGYAAKFNDTIGYFGDIAVDWWVDLGTTNASTSPTTGSDTSDFYSGFFGGTATWWADDLAGHTDSVTFNVIPPGVDTIDIVDNLYPAGISIPTLTLDVGKTVIGYAAGINNTIGYFTDVIVDWTVTPSILGEDASTDPGPATTADFYSGTIGGTVTWTADYNSGAATDSVTVNINSPTVDYIEIVDTPLTGGGFIQDQVVIINTFIVGYAAAFNNTIGYIGDVDADWSVVNTLGAVADTNPKLATNTSTLSAGALEGHTNWTATFGPLSDMVQFDITPHLTDYIVIVDTPSVGLTEIPDKTLLDSIGVGITIKGYAASFNYTEGYLGDVTVTWIVTPSATENATSLPGSGIWSDFWSGWIGGFVVWKASYWDSVRGVWLDDVVNITIDPPAVNYIKIVDTMGTGLTEIPDQDIFVGKPVTGYAAMFNDTIGYFGDIAVGWTVDNPPGTTNASTDPPSGSITSDFYSGFFGGTATWWADDLSGHTDSVTFNVIPPGVDTIDIVDNLYPAGISIPTLTLDVGKTVTGYAAGINNTIGYFTDVIVDWTVTPSILGEDASTDPGPATTADFYSGTIGGTVTWTADYNSGAATDSVTVNINSPTVDYIEIVDTENSGFNLINNQLVVIGTTITGYAAAFNYTVLYLFDIAVSWSAVGAGSSTSPGAGTNSTFDAGGTAGTADWTADDLAGHTDTVQFQITDYLVEWIEIVDTQDVGTIQIADQSVNVGYTMPGYAAAFNSSAPGTGYLGDITVTWTVTPAGGEDAYTTPPSGPSSNFYSGTIAGTVNWSAEDVDGHIDWVIITINPPEVDYILIVDIGDIEILPQTVGVGVTITGYAAGYNSTTGNYVQDVQAAWDILPFGTENATTTPGNGTSSDFWSGWIAGSVTWRAEYGGMTDTVDIAISQAVVNRIEIVDTMGTGVTPIPDQSVAVEDTITGYAAGFNTTIGYFGDVLVDWSINPSGTENATTTPGPGTPSTSSVFWAGWIGGSVGWEADYGGITDTVIITIIPPSINYIDIVDMDDVPILDQAVNVGVSIKGYAAGFNDTIGYVMDVSADWNVIPSGTEDAVSQPATQTYSNFFSGNVSGSVGWRADYNGMTDTVAITINTIVLNFIEIVDTASIGTTPIPDQTVDVGVTITGYAAGFNYTIGYIGDVDASWSVTPSGLEDASTDPDTGTSTTADFLSGSKGGSVTWEADFYGLTDTVTIAINPPTVDYITIVDTADTGATEIPDQTVSTNIPVTGYAAAFNDSIGYFSDITVSWTVTPAGTEDASTTPGSGVSSGFNSGTVDGSVTWTADDLSGHTDTVVFTIRPPTIDYIEIVDTQDVGTTTIPDQTVNVGATITGYAAGFNDTTGYVRDVSADWTVTPSGTENASTDAGPAITAVFRSGTIGGSVDWKAAYSGMTYTVTITINPPTVDSIKIMDAADNAGNEVTALEINDDQTEDLYAAGFNTTTGYVGDVDATWNTDLGSVSPTTGTTTTYTPVAGTGTLTAAYGTLTASVALTINDVTPPATPSAPTLRVEDGKVVGEGLPTSPPADVAEYIVERLNPDTGNWEEIETVPAGTTSFTDDTVEKGKTYSYRLKAVDAAGNPSDPSPAVEIKIPKGEGEFPWILLLIIIIIVIVIILLLLFLMTRKKPEEEEMPPEEGAAPLEMPEEEMPMEEAGLGAAAVAAPPPPGEEAEEAAPEELICPGCGGKMEYIEDYDQYYCYTCGKYDSEFEEEGEEGGEGGEEMPEGEGEPPSEEPGGEEPPKEDEEPPGEGGVEFEENPPEY